MVFWVEVMEGGRLLPHTWASRGEEVVGPSWIYRGRDVWVQYSRKHWIHRNCPPPMALVVFHSFIGFTRLHVVNRKNEHV